MPLSSFNPLIAAIGGRLEYDLYIEEVALEIGLPADKIRTAVQAANANPKPAQSDGPPRFHPRGCLNDVPPFEDGPPPGNSMKGLHRICLPLKAHPNTRALNFVRPLCRPVSVADGCCSLSRRALSLSRAKAALR